VKTIGFATVTLMVENLKSWNITAAACCMRRTLQHKYRRHADKVHFTACHAGFIHSSVICQTTGPQPLPKRFLHLKRSRASSFKWEYPLLSPRSSSNCLRLLPRLLVTSIRPFTFPSITSFRRQFLRKIWPMLAYPA
jgi:hypothetical protein